MDPRHFVVFSPGSEYIKGISPEQRQQLPTRGPDEYTRFLIPRSRVAKNRPPIRVTEATVLALIRLSRHLNELARIECFDAALRGLAEECARDASAIALRLIRFVDARVLKKHARATRLPRALVDLDARGVIVGARLEAEAVAENGARALADGLVMKFEVLRHWLAAAPEADERSAARALK